MADMILLGLAIICTAYFMVIVFYAGILFVIEFFDISFEDNYLFLP